MKKSIYEKIYKTLNSLFNSNPPLSFQAKMSLSASVLAYQFENWIFCGFYVRCNKRNLEIGPYQGDVIAGSPIKKGKGVCGKSYELKEEIIVPNVNKFPNYIACDSITKSEIVLPVFHKNQLIAILDIDGKHTNQFDKIDSKYLKQIIKTIF